MKKKNYKRKRGPVQAKKVTYDGINFASGLERYMYIALKKAKIKAKYEGQTYEIVSGFDFIIECKGRANESFPLRLKLFKKYVSIHLPHVILYKPQNQKECDKTVELILNSRS